MTNGCGRVGVGEGGIGVAVGVDVGGRGVAEGGTAVEVPVGSIVSVASEDDPPAEDGNPPSTRTADMPAMTSMTVIQSRSTSLERPLRIAIIYR
jgi:hypothetical protein